MRVSGEAVKAQEAPGSSFDKVGSLGATQKEPRGPQELGEPQGGRFCAALKALVRVAIRTDRRSCRCSMCQKCCLGMLHQLSINWPFWLHS